MCTSRNAWSHRGRGFSSGTAAERSQDEKHLHHYLGARSRLGLRARPWREQPYWDQHADFMDQLFENGTVILGGPFADATGSMAMVEAESEQEVADLFARDPFEVQGIFARSHLKQCSFSGCSSRLPTHVATPCMASPHLVTATCMASLQPRSDPM